MATKYNSELIDNLYQVTNEEKAADIADEMKEIGDPIFIYPIYAAYRKFRMTFMSHYFLTDLIGFKQPESTEILKKITIEQILNSADTTYLIDFCIENEHYPEEFTRQIRKRLLEISSAADDYDLLSYLRYFFAAEKIEEIELLLVSIFEGNELSLDAHKTALKYLLKYDVKKYLKYYYNNYDKIKDSKMENIFAKELNRWKGGIVSKFKEKIIKEGSERAQEIIKEKFKKDKIVVDKKEAEREKNTDRKFSNAEIASDIINIREKINTLTTGDIRFGFPLFVSAENLFKQTISVEDEHQLIGCCMELRTIIQGINEKVSQHGISLEDARKHIVGLSKEGSINNFQLFLTSRKIAVDSKLFGIREVVMTLSEFAHPSDKKGELIKQLRSVGLYDAHKSGDWSGLHRKLLTMYKDSLFKLNEAISKTELKVSTTVITQ